MQVKDVIMFIRSHDKKGPLAHWKDETLCLFIKTCIDHQAFLWASENGKLLGVAFGRWRPNRVMHVEYMLTLKNCLCKFIKTFLDKFPGTTLIAFRHGKLKNLTHILEYYGKRNRSTIG